MALPAVTAGVRVRDLTRVDLRDVVRIDALHTGVSKPEYWRRVFGDFLRRAGGTRRVGLAAETGGDLAGYLLGEVRAFEFGSPPCGWVFAVGVDPGRLRHGVASALLEEACRRFRRAKVDEIRTMIRRTDVPVLSFFRANGFVGGPFMQLERSVTERRDPAPARIVEEAGP